MRTTAPRQTDATIRRYKMEWSCPEGFAVWLSIDRMWIQFCGPDGEELFTGPARPIDPESP
jgi:hypothetical protein